MAEQGELVLVTGASGFIATHVVQQLQQAGYGVRGTVRSTKNDEKVKPLRELCPDSKHPLELVEADLTQPDSWKAAVKDCTYVIHTASPFPAENPRHEGDLLKPAVEGALSVLRACSEAGTVKRVVLTSSLAAINGGFGETVKVSEENWTDPDKSSSPYYKSKTLAEKAAWDFVRELPEEKKFELAVINPGYVLGPVLCGGFATSMAVHTRLLKNDIPMLPRNHFVVVDVRDVAVAHVKAMTLPEAAGHRHILASHPLWIKDIAQILSDEFRPLGYKIPLKEAPYFLMKIASLFDKSVKMILPSWGKEGVVDNTRMTQVLGIEPRSAKDTVVEMGYSLIERGFVNKTEKYKRAMSEKQPAAEK